MKNSFPLCKQEGRGKVLLLPITKIRMPAQPLARVKTCPVLSIHEMEEQNVEETTHVIPSSTTSSGAEVAVTSRALDCLRVLTEGGHLCQNICHFSIEDQGNMHEDVEGFEAKVAKHIPTIVQNACTELLHLLPTVPSDVFPSLLPHLTAFTTHHLLAWIEILSLTSSLDVFLHRVPAILARLSQTSPLYQSFHNAYRMVRFYYGPISTNWAQIYRTALPLSPNFICTPIDEEAPSPITVASGRPADWGPLMCVWKDPSESVEARYAANGTLIVSVAGGMAIRVRDAVTGEVFHEWTDFGGARIQKFAVARNGRLLSYATEAGIFVLALEDASVPREIGSKVLDVDAMAFKDDGKVLAVATSSAKVGKVVFYHINSDSVNEAPQIISSILTEDPVLDLAFSTINTAVVNACTQNAVTSFSFKKALTTSVSRFQKPESTITSAGMAHRGDFCAYGTKKGELFLWRKVDESCTLSFLSKYVSPVTSIKVSENDQLIISSYENGTIILFDMPKGRKSVFDIAHAASISTIDISFSPYSEIITAAMDGTIRVWDTEGLFDYCPESDPVAVKHSITRHEKTIQTVAISSNGRLVAASTNGTTDIMVWDLRRAQTQPRKLLAHVGIITCLAFSKTSGFLILASGSEDRTVRIWDPETGMEFFCCNVLAHIPRTLEFSLGGTHVQIGVETATGEKRMLDWSWRNGRQPTSMRTDSVRLRGQPTPNFHDYSLDIDHERGWITFRKTRPSLTDSNSTLTPSPSRILTWLDPRWRVPIALASVILTPSTSSRFPHPYTRLPTVTIPQISKPSQLWH
ncbi:WD40-repeat-containing domain protein [Chytridium lagenaria]|nr:WD40-repeat-containing domain protein [Chytridium lagenaria]